MASSLWGKVAIAVQSALATALTISGITKANPGVVTYTGTDPSNGDYVVLTIQGMHQLNRRVFRVANVNGGGNTFELEGEDTSLYDTFSAGTAEVITYGTTLATVRGLNASGGDFNMVDDTTVHDAIKQEIPGLANALVYNMDNRWDPSDAGLIALRAASLLKAERAMKFTFSNGYKMLGVGYIGATLAPVGQAQDLVTTPSVVTLRGFPTYYLT
jgi:tail tube protein